MVSEKLLNQSSKSVKMVSEFVKAAIKSVQVF